MPSFQDLHNYFVEKVPKGRHIPTQGFNPVDTDAMDAGAVDAGAVDTDAMDTDAVDAGAVSHVATQS